jgi:predicted hydrolase (HD superfamily)
MMRKLAKRLRADEDKWELVGLLHDLDYDLVREDMSKHGIVAGETLNRRLPPDSLQAIRSHDHRTGIKPKSELDKALVVADTVVAIAMEVETRRELTAESLEREIETISASKPWYKDNLRRSDELGLRTTEALRLGAESVKDMLSSASENRQPNQKSQ